MCFKTRIVDTSYVIRNLEFGREQQLCCLTLWFLTGSPLRNPSDLSPSDLARTEGQEGFCKIYFSNWPLELTHSKLRHSGCELELGKHVAPSLICWDSILVCKGNLIGTFKFAISTMLLAVSDVYSAQTLGTRILCFSRLNIMVWSFCHFLTFSSITTLLFTSNFK